MPCGPQLIEAVASMLSTDDGMEPNSILFALNASCSLRAIRYAITELIKTGRARRDGRNGPVYAVRSE